MTKHRNEYGVENIAGTEKALWNLIEKSTSGQMRTNCNETDQNLKMSKFFIHLVWMCPIFAWTQSNHGLQQPHYSKNLVALLSHLKTCKGSNLKAFMIENFGLILTKKNTLSQLHAVVSLTERHCVVLRRVWLLLLIPSVSQLHECCTSSRSCIVLVLKTYLHCLSVTISC